MQITFILPIRNEVKSILDVINSILRQTIINDFEYDSVKKEIIFHTNFDYSFPLNNNHELTLKTHKGKEYPIVKVRSSIEGLINRSVFYKLIDIGISQNNNNKGKDLMIKSFDSLHRLGKLS